jgi:hypothetical protein
VDGGGVLKPKTGVNISNLISSFHIETDKKRLKSYDSDL